MKVVAIILNWVRIAGQENKDSWDHTDSLQLAQTAGGIFIQFKTGLPADSLPIGRYLISGTSPTYAVGVGGYSAQYGSATWSPQNLDSSGHTPRPAGFPTLDPQFFALFLKFLSLGPPFPHCVKHF
jgi:hypothetical protein